MIKLRSFSDQASRAIGQSEEQNTRETNPGQLRERNEHSDMVFDDCINNDITVATSIKIINIRHARI